MANGVDVGALIPLPSASVAMTPTPTECVAPSAGNDLNAAPPVNERPAIIPSMRKLTLFGWSSAIVWLGMFAIPRTFAPVGIVPPAFGDWSNVVSAKAYVPGATASVSVQVRGVPDVQLGEPDAAEIAVVVGVVLPDAVAAIEMPNVDGDTNCALRDDEDATR